MKQGRSGDTINLDFEFESDEFDLSEEQIIIDDDIGSSEKEYEEDELDNDYYSDKMDDQLGQQDDVMFTSSLMLKSSDQSKYGTQSMYITVSQANMIIQIPTKALSPSLQTQSQQQLLQLQQIQQLKHKRKKEEDEEDEEYEEDTANGEF
ncbi:MAG: hypothetical protein EZS28_001616 [Streblomastix strix]|uniref:Uncharacterized protein n=1 Tax=Streblomastix strix TaxID=222440 RepID=A0A5J4X768_9EUKA|nr:MAG: hypothetical protein EZS28_001616 [Streblomastix strix]